MAWTRLEWACCHWTQHGFSLHCRCRYGWAPSRTPTSYACGANFTMQHMLSCQRGGSPSIRHNKIRDIIENLLSEVCNDVRVEPELQELTTEELSGRTANTTNGARLDITINGFWEGDSSCPFWTLGSSIPTHFPTGIPPSRNASEDKSWRKKGPILNA